MAGKTTIDELRKMQLPDHLKEIIAQQNMVCKLRLGVKLGKEKDSAKYIRERKQLARMKTVYNQNQAEKAAQDAQTSPSSQS